METRDDLFTLIDTLSLEGDVEQAKGMSAYMRDQFEFLGKKHLSAGSFAVKLLKMPEKQLR
ncbi:hypothetical protein FC30_GL001276 [Ligilactobacillus animalis KCTC 3501 = DSM 20602]|nr:hypothetical protein FC30_GL001276 [Ligilactobacillus animalis KCTC 3501 = DSM 20602]